MVILYKRTAMSMSRFWRMVVAALLLVSIGSADVGDLAARAFPSRDEVRGWTTPGPQRAFSGILQPGPVVPARVGPPTPAPPSAASWHALRSGSPLRKGAQPNPDRSLVPDTSPWLGAPLPDPGHNPLPAPGDPRRLTLFRDTTVPVHVGETVVVSEPSTDQLGRDIFATGNYHAEFSRDNGQLWQELNPETIFGPDFCCDQVTIADPQYHQQDWILQYIPFFIDHRPGSGHLVLATSPVGDFVN